MEDYKVVNIFTGEEYFRGSFEECVVEHNKYEFGYIALASLQPNFNNEWRRIV